MVWGCAVGYIMGVLQAYVVGAVVWWHCGDVSWVCSEGGPYCPERYLRSLVSATGHPRAHHQA